MIQDNPEFAAATMELKGQGGSGFNSDDFDALSQAVGKGTELSPRSIFFPDAAPEFLFRLVFFCHAGEKSANVF